MINHEYLKILGHPTIYVNTKKNMCSKYVYSKTHLELTDIDQIYRVLKQAGDLQNKANVTADKSVVTSSSSQQQKTVTIDPNILQDIPIVNVPECPGRNMRVASGKTPLTSLSSVVGSVLSSQHKDHQQQQQQQQQGKGLSAPVQDVSSCSGPTNYPIINTS